MKRSGTMEKMMLRFFLCFVLVTGLTATFAQAQTVLNPSFQDPFPGGDGNVSDEDAYDVANGNPAPSSWTFVNSANDNYGQARPGTNQFTRDVTGGEFSPFTAGGFADDLIVFANMNSVGAYFEASQTGVDTIQAGIYRLTVAVGGRNTGSWNDLLYQVGLTANGSSVGSTSVTIDPGNVAGNLASSPWTTNDYNVVDVTFTLGVGAASPLIGQDLGVLIHAENPGTKGGSPGTSFTQAAIDNARVTYEIPEPATMSLLGLGGLAALRRRRC